MEKSQLATKIEPKCLLLPLLAKTTQSLELSRARLDEDSGIKTKLRSDFGQPTREQATHLKRVLFPTANCLTLDFFSSLVDA